MGGKPILFAGRSKVERKSHPNFKFMIISLLYCMSPLKRTGCIRLKEMRFNRLDLRACQGVQMGVKMEIIESMLNQNPCFQAGKKITVKGLMLHSVGCPQPCAETFVRNWNNPKSARACVHAFIDGSTGKVYQTLPWDYRAWHCGGSGNNSYIGVEMCEPSCIRYTDGSAFTCSDREKAMKAVELTYKAAVELFASLCTQFGLNPLADGVIISHKEGHERGLASGHADPDHLWKGMTCSYTMDSFRRDVSNFRNHGEVPAPAGEETKVKESPQAEASPGIMPKDTVSLAPDAVYYNGKIMPDWVKNDCWIVKSLEGDRAVIDRNVSGSRSICSPVKVQYLIKQEERK